MPKDVNEIVRSLELEPHPEGGWYKRIYAHSTDMQSSNGTRPIATAIQYLLPAGLPNRWHRIDADEMWHHYKGDRLILETADSSGPVSLKTEALGKDATNNEEPVRLVSAGVWQRAYVPEGGAYGWAFAGCTVSPGFLFEGWEVLEKGEAPWD